ncbi:MAG TPA: bifunctional phosphoribosyl-AMP cyclohydrolase/phosphoribosyl-ATP diphosphatase HisIE [Acidobacteriota bacterium]|jgi:phosphoribosyl-ATP pyrophosphohydrolase/phosphoribosyl-AMP cyclohydrolase
MPDEVPLIPTIAQDADSGDVLMLAYSSTESLRKTLETGVAHYWSRARNALWRKGETSGNTQAFVSGLLDCDADALLFRVRPAGPACHTGSRSCFFTPVTAHASLGAVETGLGRGDTGTRGGGDTDAFSELFRVIESRRREKPENSYTARLIEDGVDRIGKKIAEESGEVIIAAKNHSRQELLRESADLVYHLMVLLASQDLKWSELADELKKRRKG